MQKDHPSSAEQTQSPKEGIAFDLETLKKKFGTEESMRLFFNQLNFEKYWYVTFPEFRTIFGETLEENSLGRVKKYWSEINVSYFNLNYDYSWYYKWSPVFLKLIYNTSNDSKLSIYC